MLPTDKHNRRKLLQRFTQHVRLVQHKHSEQSSEVNLEAI